MAQKRKTGKGKVVRGGGEGAVGIGDEGISRGRSEERRKKPALRPSRSTKRSARAADSSKARSIRGGRQPTFLLASRNCFAPL